MGYISNQWLKGVVERNRGYFPISVSFKLEKLDNSPDSWVTQHNVAAGILASKQDNVGDYQAVYFSEEDLSSLLPELSKAANFQTQKKLAFDVLHRLDDVELLSFLSELLPSRPSTKV